MKRSCLLAFFLLAGIAIVSFHVVPVYVDVLSAYSTSSRHLDHKLPAFLFEQNAGQFDPDTQFVARGSQYDLSLRGSKMIFKGKQRRGQVGEGPTFEGDVSLTFVGGKNELRLQGEDRRVGVINYYVGAEPNRWHSGVHTFGRIRYPSVYPGVDLILYSANESLEFDFQVASGTDPRQIRVTVAGGFSLSKEGDLVLGTGSWVRLRKPRAYQVVDGREREIVASYAAEGSQLGINVGEYDRSATLIVDPVVVYQGYVPYKSSVGTLYSGATSVATDVAGHVYLASSDDGGKNGPFDCIVTKIDSTGTILYKTVYGSLVSGYHCAIGADPQGNAYITGTTAGGIPVTQEVVQPNSKGGLDAFAAKFTSTGQLAYGTYIGGSGTDTGSGIAIDGNGNAYLTGFTSSNDFPVANAFQSSMNGTGDAFVTVINTTASAYIYSTYLGGSSGAAGVGVAVDAAGHAYVTGTTSSADFPLKNPLQSSCTPCNPGSFVTAFDPSGSSLVYSTYLSFSALAGPAIASDQNGNVFVAAGVSNAVAIVSMNASGSLNFSNSIAATGLDYQIGVGVDRAGNAYIGGFLLDGGEITAFNPLQPAAPSFVASYTSSGTLIYATPLDGEVSGVAGAEAGSVYIAGVDLLDWQPCCSAGWYFSVNLDQPPSPAFISKISAQDGSALAYLPPFLSFGSQPVGVASQPQTLTLKDLGTTTLNLDSIIVSGPGFALSGSTCGSTLIAAGAGTCSLSITFTPVDLNPASGALTITDNSLGSPHVIQLSGQGAVPVVSFNPTSLSFSSTIVGQSSTAAALTLTNTGQAPLSISRIAISGDFSETNNCGTTVAPGQNCLVTVIFTPTVSGNRSGAVTITDNAAGSPHSVTLSGTGVSPGLGLGTGSGSGTATVSAGQTANYTLSIGGLAMTGTATLTCSGAPRGATCSVPSTVAVNGTAASTFQVSVSTTSRVMAATTLHDLIRSGVTMAMIVTGLIFIPGLLGRRCSKNRRAGIILVWLSLFCSCGGNSQRSSTNPNGTPAGTYNLNISATMNSTTENVTLKLIVQ